MITSNSTYAEIEAQKTLDEQNIQDYMFDEMEHAVPYLQFCCHSTI